MDYRERIYALRRLVRVMRRIAINEFNSELLDKVSELEERLKTQIGGGSNGYAFQTWQGYAFAQWKRGKKTCSKCGLKVTAANSTYCTVAMSSSHATTMQAQNKLCARLQTIEFRIS